MIKKFPEIGRVINEIVELVEPKQILLFHAKGLSHPLVGFKLCIIQDKLSREELERQVYIGVDSEVPFDIVTYTPGEWEQLSVQEGSFASRIQQTGVVVYG